MEAIKEERKGKFEEKFVMNNGWMRGLSKDEVDRKNEEFRRWIRDGPPGEQGAQKEGEAIRDGGEDEIMVDG